MDIKLRLVNYTHDVNDSNVVIFQQNVAEGFDELAVAWRVVRNLGLQCIHPFTYPLEFTIGAGDSWGNVTPQFAATVGERWEMVRDHTGDVLKICAEPARSYEEIELMNGLVKGGISARIYRDGKLLAQKTNVSPGQKAVFKFLPRIYLGVVSEVDEGDVMNSAILQDLNSEINLLGVRNADIVMTGGGAGPKATPFEFNLANINKA